MRFWLGANLFLIAFVLATVGLVFLSTWLIFQLGLAPLNERIACSTAAVVVMISVGLLFRRLLARIQRRASLKT